MKKLIRFLFFILLLGVGFLYVVKNPSLPISQKILSAIGIDMKASESTELDLTNCLSYFDGCNTCSVVSGQVAACTKMYCETPAEPQCLEYAYTGMDLSGCLNYFDGCNNCSVKDGKPEACTEMYCETPSEPKCTLYATGDILSGETKSNLSTFSDPELGISFSYPNTWGTITKESENNSDGVKYLITLLNNGEIFFAFHNGATPLARGSFWGDEAKDINSSSYINDFCTNKTNCTLHTNANGIQYAKYYEEYGEMGSTQTSTRLMYYLFNPNSSFRGIIMSNKPEADLDAIIESIQFN